MDNIPTGKLNENISRADTSDLYNNVVSQINLLTHPFSCFLHILFKSFIFLSYCLFPHFFGLFTGVSPDYIFSFSVVLIFVVVDFLVVKNYTSVNLIGVLWYLDIKENGSFDVLNKKIKDQVFLNNTQIKYFWFITYAWPLMWFLITLFRLTFFKLSPLVLSSLVCTAGLVNLYNCTMCFDDKRSLLQDKLNKVTKMIQLK